MCIGRRGAVHSSTKAGAWLLDFLHRTPKVWAAVEQLNLSYHNWDIYIYTLNNMVSGIYSNLL